MLCKISLRATGSLGGICDVVLRSISNLISCRVIRDSDHAVQDAQQFFSHLHRFIDALEAAECDDTLCDSLVLLMNMCKCGAVHDAWVRMCLVVFSAATVNPRHIKSLPNVELGSCRGLCIRATEHHLPRLCTSFYACTSYRVCAPPSIPAHNSFVHSRPLITVTTMLLSFDYYL